MSRQIPLIGYIGDIKQDGGYDVTVKTADGITVGKYEMDDQGQPVVKDYVEQAKSASKVYVTDAQGKDSAKPLSDFAMQSDIPVVPTVPKYYSIVVANCDVSATINDVVVVDGHGDTANFKGIPIIAKTGDSVTIEITDAEAYAFADVDNLVGTGLSLADNRISGTLTGNGGNIYLLASK